LSATSLTRLREIRVIALIEHSVVTERSLTSWRIKPARGLISRHWGENRIVKSTGKRKNNKQEEKGKSGQLQAVNDSVRNGSGRR